MKLLTQIVKNSLLLGLCLFVSACTKTAPLSNRPSPTPVASWVYQLQAVDLKRIADQGSDIVVIDPSRHGDGDSAGFWEAPDLETLDKESKTVLAYLAIGEAEDYRDYWQAGWKRKPPDFIAKSMDDQFQGNYAVRYWSQAWRQILLERVDRISKAGFDGVYLDKVDAFEDWAGAGTEVDLQKEMVALIAAIAERGKSNNPNFQVYLQNGWAIWNRPELLKAVDGVAIEELSLGWEGEDGAATPPEVREEMFQALEGARSRGWTLLVVDYPGPDSDPGTRRAALEQARRVGAVPLLAPRDLDG